MAIPKLQKILSGVQDEDTQEIPQYLARPEDMTQQPIMPAQSADVAAIPADLGSFLADKRNVPETNLRELSPFEKYLQKVNKVPTQEDMTAYNSNLRQLGLPVSQTPLRLESDLPINLMNQELKQEEPVPASATEEPSTKVLSKISSMTRTASPEAKQAQALVSAAAKPVDLSDKEFEAAQEQARQNRMMSGMLQAGSTIGQALASLGAGRTVTTDQAGIENLIKSAGMPVSDLTAKRQAEKTMLDLLDDRAKNDPNSPISGIMKQALQELAPGMKIPSNFTAAQAEKSFPSITAAINAKLAREQKAIDRERLHEEKLSRLSEKTNRSQDTYLQVAQGRMGKSVDNYLKAKAAADSVNTMTGKNPAEQITVLYSFVKGLDPDSAVREGEVGLAREIASLQGKLQMQINKISEGEAVDEKTLKNLKAEVIRLSKVQESTYANKARGFIEGAKNRGIPEERYEEFAPGITDLMKKGKTKVDPKIEQYAKQHSLDYAAAEKLLRARGYSGE